MKYSFINKVAAVVMTVCAFALSSCEEKPGPEIPQPELSVKSPTIGYKAGSIFVSVKCAGEWTLSVSYSGQEKDWASLSVGSGTGDKAVVLSYQANTSNQYSRTLRLVLTQKNGSVTVVCDITQVRLGEDLDAKPVVPDVDVTKVDWLELPAMDDDSGLEYYAHKFEMGGKAYRNYSFGWNQDEHVSLWVAYPLNKFYTSGNVGRTDEWSYDPYLGKGRSSAPFGGYAGSYARGHQLPSGDRQLDREANAQTFYGTNIAPQLNEHNEGIWATLEGKVRGWANTSDTTYVVTGCVLEGSKTTTKDSDGNKMTVPVAFYKALLRYHKASTISQWSCAAFYTEHKDYANRDLKAVSMSIDELEEITGIDFFANLPAKLGKEKAAEIEALKPTDAKVSGIWF